MDLDHTNSLTLDELNVGLKRVLKIDLIDPKPVINNAYHKSIQIVMERKKTKENPGHLDRVEFRLMILYLFLYFYYY